MGGPPEPRKAVADVFLSYKREEIAPARTLASALELRGWSVWWDAKLRAGERFDDVIEAAIRDARAVVVLWSRLSVRSGYVRDEARLALELDKLVPLALDDAPPPLGFRSLHTIPFAGWNGAATHPVVDLLVAGIERLAPAGPPAPSTDDGVDDLRAAEGRAGTDSATSGAGAASAVGGSGTGAGASVVDCPACRTVYRMSAEILRYALEHTDGKVRCGKCGAAFDAGAGLRFQAPR